MAYTVRLKPRTGVGSVAHRTAAAHLKKLPGSEEEPRPPGSSKPAGSEGYRILAGDHRVVYLIDDPARTVEIVRISHRREVYR